MVKRNFLALALLCAGFSAARADQQWVEVNSPHFSVATDGGEKRAREVALRFEQMRMAFGLLFQKISVNTAPLQIIAFRNGKELRQISPLYNGKPIELAGLFLGGGGSSRPGSIPERQYIALDLTAEDNWGVVFHEYAHLLINSNFPPSPVWFDEGFAEYCSSLKVDKKEVSIGLVRPDLPQTLGQNRWLKLVDLFSVKHDSKIYNRDDRRSVFYAQSWITIHYFMSKQMMKQVAVFVALAEDQHVAISEAIRRGFGMEPEALEKAIENYFHNSGVTYFRAPAPPGADAVSFTSRALNDVDVKTVLADLDFHTRDYRQRGIAAFQEVLAKQPENVVANRGLGYDALQRNDWDKAGEYFRRAAAQDVKDPQVHYLLAMMLTRNGMSTDDEKDLETIKKELNAAITLDPGYADAYNLLGITLTQAGDEKEAIAALTKAVQLSPRNPWYSGNLVNAYMRAQDLEHAIPLLREMQKSSEPQIAARAEQQLQQLEAYQARQRAGSATRVEASAGTVKIVEEEEEAPRPLEPQPAPQQPQVSFMHGTLVSVDCSKPPAATFIVSSSGKQWKLLAPQQKKVVLMGAEEISCSWTNRKVAVNYRRTGNDTGSIVSLELE